jgi:hypothetical protein
MHVVHPELTRPFSLLESRPRADPHDVVPPSLRGDHLRRVAEPERAAVDNLEPFLAVQDRGVLALGLAIVPPDADLAVDGEGFAEVIKLAAERLLQPYHIRVVVADELVHLLAPLLPPVFAIARVVVPDVVRQDA